MENRIVVNPNIHFGKPCVAGTRIPVQSILELVGEGFPFADIVRDYYPNLEIKDIRACIQYALLSTWAELNYKFHHKVTKVTKVFFKSFSLCSLCLCGE